MRTALALNALLGIAVAILYLAVASITARRRTSTTDADRARRSFVIWWGALALTSGIGSLQQLLAALGIDALPIHIALTFLVLPALFIALAGLLQYLVYIHTGSHRWRATILGANLALAVFYFGLILYLEPTGLKVSDWSAPLDYARDTPGWVMAFGILSILAPVVVASFAYFTLAFRTDDNVARFRILTVSGAFLVWFGSAGVAALFHWTDWYWWPLVARAISLVATLLILFAYSPPKMLEQKLRANEQDEIVVARGGTTGWRLAYLLRARQARSRGGVRSHFTSTRCEPVTGIS